MSIEYEYWSLVHVGAAEAAHLRNHQGSLWHRSDLTGCQRGDKSQRDNVSSDPITACLDSRCCKWRWRCIFKNQDQSGLLLNQADPVPKPGRVFTQFTVMRSEAAEHGRTMVKSAVHRTNLSWTETWSVHKPAWFTVFTMLMTLYWPLAYAVSKTRQHIANVLNTQKKC